MFWSHYRALPPAIQSLADKNFALLKTDPTHPSLRLKPVGPAYSARVGLRYRAPAYPEPQGLVWFWIGSHADYDKLLANLK